MDDLQTLLLSIAIALFALVLLATALFARKLAVLAREVRLENKRSGNRAPESAEDA